MTSVPIFCKPCEKDMRPSRLIAVPYICVRDETERRVHLACPYCDMTDEWAVFCRVSPPTPTE